MGRKKKLLNIKVETLPNGYALTVGNKQYMYFDAQKLLAGMFYHIGLEKNDFFNTAMIENLMVAAATWPTVGEAIEANATLMADKQEAEREARLTRNQCQKMSIEYDNLSTKIANLLIQNGELKEKVFLYEKRTHVKL